MAGSMLLHAIMLIAALRAAASLPSLPPQQLVEIMLVAESSGASETERRAEPKTRKPAMETEKTMRPLSALAPASGAGKAAAPDAASLVTTKPSFNAEYLRNPAPEYPAAAKRRRMEGTVMLDVTVTADGRPQRVDVSRSSGFSLLDDSARQAVQRWSFVPARRGDQALEARVIVPVEFRLE